MSTRDKLLELIHEHGLAQYADAILNVTKPAIHISRKRVAGEAQIPVGASKLGGSPDVPPGFVWPQWNGAPLTFIGQFRLSDAAPFDVEHALPTTGMLSFFYAADAQTYGAPDQRGSWKVAYFANEAALNRASQPVSAGGSSKGKALFPCSVALSQELTLPVNDENPGSDGYVMFSHGSAQTAKLPTDKIDSLDDVRAEIAKSGGPLHQLLGNPAQVQGDIRYECQFNANNVPPGTLQDGDAALEKGISDWRLLLQITSDDAADGLGMIWGDIGTLYFCMKDDALKRRDFGACWLTMQQN